MDLIHSDDAMGVRTNTHIDVDGTVAIRRWQDVESIMRRCMEEQKETNGHEIEGVGRHLGDIPHVLLEAYCQFRGVRWEAVLYGNDHNEILKDCLNEYSKFKTTRAKF